MGTSEAAVLDMLPAALPDPGESKAEESGPGELDDAVDDIAPADADALASSSAAAAAALHPSGSGASSPLPPPPPAPLDSRRGTSSLRDALGKAFLEATFPAYPASPPPEEPFSLPPGFVDKDAPTSARKWCVPPREMHRRACLTAASTARASLPPAALRHSRSPTRRCPSPLCLCARAFRPQGPVHAARR